MSRSISSTQTTKTCPCFCITLYAASQACPSPLGTSSAQRAQPALPLTSVYLKRLLDRLRLPHDLRPRRHQQASC
eukprot:352926-Chlamydomonas_euryale.AAC.6